MVKVSVCIPTYNRSHYLQYAIHSVLTQTYYDFELIVCDDGSTDDTPEIIKNINDSRLIYLRHPQNIGKSNNMRSGFNQATGKYFIKFDDDDALCQDFLTKTVQILEENNDIDFVSTDHWIIDNKSIIDDQATKINSQKWHRETLKEGIINDLLKQVFINQVIQIGATLFRKTVLEEIDFLLPNIQNCEDNDLLVRLAVKNKTGYYLPSLLMKYRFHNEQISTEKSLQYLHDYLDYLNRFNFTDQEIEKYRLSKVLKTKVSLGLKLIEAGKNQEGRKLIRESAPFTPLNKRGLVGLTLSYFPHKLTNKIINILRQIKPQDYADQIRNN
ncbi:MAG: glycosyltransferase family 2 protein [Cyanobacterium sp. T60_A2020_053]|nr:glycosyltransferase family 2 protein [Cyanobacterium sp. T60_A2020_053]